MDPLTIALICAAALGATIAFSAFIRQIMISRDKNLNDEAQRRALAQEAGELERMREQMQSNKRFDTHYKVLGTNKDAIVYLDTKIEDILSKKAKLVERYSQVALKESGAIIDGEFSEERKEACDRLKQEIDDEIKFYDNELEHLQERRGALWDTHSELQEYLVGQEKSRNESLDFIYKRHSGILEKVYIRHTEDSEHVARDSIQAGTSAFKMILLAPVQLLLQYFSLSTNVSTDRAILEQTFRDEVSNIENFVNEDDKVDYPDSLEVKSDSEDEMTTETDGTGDNTESGHDTSLALV